MNKILARLLGGPLDQKLVEIEKAPIVALFVDSDQVAKYRMTGQKSMLDGIGVVCHWYQFSEVIKK